MENSLTTESNAAGPRLNQRHKLATHARYFTVPVYLVWVKHLMYNQPFTVLITEPLNTSFSPRFIDVVATTSQICVFFPTAVAKRLLTLYLFKDKTSLTSAPWKRSVALKQGQEPASFFFSPSSTLVEQRLVVPAGWKHSTRPVKFDFHALCETSGNIRRRVSSSCSSKWARYITAQGRGCNSSGTTWERCRARKWG